MAEIGYERGHAAGYLQVVADVKAVQHGLVAAAELEVRRWGPGGRAHFADARPGEYLGRRNGGSQMNQPNRVLPAPEAGLADPGADQLPQILAMAAEAEPEAEIG